MVLAWPTNGKMNSLRMSVSLMALMLDVGIEKSKANLQGCAILGSLGLLAET